MEILENFEFKNSSRSVYDWNTILDGKIRKLVKGTDFKCTTDSMSLNIKATAKAKGIKVKVQIDKGDVVVQACH